MTSSTHLRYPDRAVNNIQGTAIITFRVEQDGHIDPMFTFVDRSVEYSIDQESLKLIAGRLPGHPLCRMVNS